MRRAAAPVSTDAHPGKSALAPTAARPPRKVRRSRLVAPCCVVDSASLILVFIVLFPFLDFADGPWRPCRCQAGSRAALRYDAVFRGPSRYEMNRVIKKVPNAVALVGAVL